MATVKPQIVRTSEMEFTYREFGVPDGLPVLFLHGFPDAPDAFDAVIERLDPAKRGWRFLVPAMRGYMGTTVLLEELVSGQTAAFGLDVLAFASALGIERFVVVGHDWGARAAFMASVLAPERVMALFTMSSPYEMTGGQDAMPIEQVDSYWYQWYFQTAMGEKVLRERAEELCFHIWQRWSPTWKFSTKEFKAAAAYWKSEQFVPVTLHAYRHRYGNALGRTAYADVQAFLDQKPKPKITVPTMFVYGTEDHCVLPVSSEEQKKHFAGKYERVAVKGVGHFPHREDAKAVAKLLAKFLNGVKR